MDNTLPVDPAPAPALAPAPSPSPAPLSRYDELVGLLADPHNHHRCAMFIIDLERQQMEAKGHVAYLQSMVTNMKAEMKQIEVVGNANVDVLLAAAPAWIQESAHSRSFTSKMDDKEMEKRVIAILYVAFHLC
jgi:hypothetical protein